MGAWGSGLYANDSTCDVRDAYEKFLRDGLDNAAAYEKTLEACREYLEDDEEPSFWFALADTQWRLGRLLPEVKAKALEWIEKDGGLDLWEESANKGAGWKKTLQTLKNRLESPAPPEKKFGKRRIIDMNIWNLNDIYAYRLNGKLAAENNMLGKYMLIQKVGDGKVWMPSGDQPTMLLLIYDKIFDKLPILDNLELNSMRILPMDYSPPNALPGLEMSVLGYVLKKNRLSGRGSHLCWEQVLSS